MAVKKLKLQSQPLLIPDGLHDLPTAVMLYQKSTGEIWANSYFESAFGPVTPTRFEVQKNLHLIHERPLQNSVLSLIGRHEGYVLQNNKNVKIPVSIKITQYGEANQETFLVMVEDVTEKLALEKEVIQNHIELQKAFEQQKNTQKALLQTSKLASLGEMASGIAHELNQPLQAILGFSQELDQSEKLSPQGKQFMEEIVNASRHMAGIIKNFRLFVRNSNEELSETSIQHVIEESVTLSKHSLMQKNIDVFTHFASDLPLIEANPTEFKQVIINMIGNSRDAIEQAGTARGKIEITAEHKKNTIELKIRDNGCGMDENTRQKIFDPFFTTKEVGKGTGLGMSISYSILKKMNAEISIQSEVGKGTEFTIILPILNSNAKGAKL